MDSITQIALGAAVGESALGRKIGGKAALAGAICGTLPDLDSFIPYQDAVATMTYHRSFSHSLIVLTLVSPVVAKAMQWLFRRCEATFREWWLLTFLALITHPLLDLFTVYGTQLLWPLTDYPFSGASVFIIDPAYTLPLAAGVIIALRSRRDSRVRLWANTAGLVWSCAYLAWTLTAQALMERRITTAMADQDLQGDTLLVTPAYFTSILWRGIVMREDGYYDVIVSVLDAPETLQFTFHPDDRALLTELQGHWPAERLAWFTHGFFALHESEGQVLMSDLRMGLEPAYTFTFAMASRASTGLQWQPARQVPVPRPLDQLGTLWDRTLHPLR